MTVQRAAMTTTNLALCAAVLLVSLSVLALIPILTISLAAIAAARHHLSRRYGGGNGRQRPSSWSDYRTALYSGRVSHARFLPVPHSFAYPLFFCCLDLSEAENLLGGKRRAAMWPLR